MLMELQNTEPFVSLTRYGKGRVYLISSPMDEQSTNFARHAIWVPLVYRMAMLSRPRENLYIPLAKTLKWKLPMLQ